MNKTIPSPEDIATGDPQMRPNDITAQDAAHESGNPCDEEDCEECCAEFCGHEYDPGEGMLCINCGKEYEGGE
jgi:hypothetical protein